ncbi:hypothetical protein DH2020_032594 [Rehmannia glutinosa]|uniref:RING-type E3 ubiquitin transferase n=1 Tax=Rehmannia glutinosa TaxID=99300 RepID=A0ABR0VHJ3_REHGL
MSNMAHQRPNSYIQVLPDAVSSTRSQPDPKSSKPDEFLISLQFSGNSISYYWATNQLDSTDPRLLDWANRPLPENSILINLHEFMCRETTRESIAIELEDWQVSDDELRRIIDMALARIRKAVISMPARHNFLYLHLRVDLIREQFIDASTIYVDDQVVRMVPAIESSIESLERKKLLVGSAAGACVVCMEEFSEECEVVSMPCLHVFHADCIKKWLRTSHYCPICRFEMPTN